MTSKKILLAFLYLVTAAATAYMVVLGGHYYLKSLVDRPHDSLHDALRPGGLWGHGLGIIGTAMMLLMLLYLARKYFRFMRKWGDIGGWLDIHIWLGITGPILVTYHTAFKFGGIVSISFWSMVAVALSGVFGRYIYLQIPRRISGEELTPEELEERDRTLNDQIVNLPSVGPELLKHIQSLAKYPDEATGSGNYSRMRSWIMDSFRLRSELRALRRRLKAQTGLNRYVISDLMRAIKERRLFHRRKMFLKVAHKLLHHWHLVHRPFAVVMYIIMAVHVVITTLLGYTWIF
jgi:hypothetical protein